MISRRQKKQRQPQQQQQLDAPLPPPELSAFSLAAAIQEARTSSPATIQQQQRSNNTNINNSRLPKISSSPLKKKNPSQASLATNTSFATANDNATLQTSEQNITPAVSYFVDSSDEETQESLTFGNDPLSVLSRNQDVKPTEISFFDQNPEETSSTMARKYNKIAPTKATAVTTSTATTPTPVPEDTKVIVETNDNKTEESEPPHFDVAQNVYGCTKDIWAWGKTIPVLSNILTLTEDVTAKVLDMTIHMDLPAIDQTVVVPHAKQLDEGIITPAICAIWGIICPAVTKGEEMIVKPVLMEVVPRILGPLGALLEKKKEEQVVEEEEEKKNVIDRSPNPEIVPVSFN